MFKSVPILSILILVIGLFLMPVTDASAREFELGVAAGYQYGYALSKTEGHGFAATVLAGRRFYDWFGVYGDFQINMSFSGKNAHKTDVVIHKNDYFYVFSGLVCVRFFQPVFNGDLYATIGIGYGYTGDQFKGEKPQSGLAAKLGVGYWMRMVDHFRIGINLDAVTNHRLDKLYNPMHFDVQLIAMVDF